VSTVEHAKGSMSGGYYDKCTRVQPSNEARDLEAAKRLWEMSERLTGLSDQ